MKAVKTAGTCLLVVALATGSLAAGVAPASAATSTRASAPVLWSSSGDLKPAVNEARDTITIPNLEGVVYRINEKTVRPGTHPVQGKVVVTAFSPAPEKGTAKQGMAWSRSWVFDLTPVLVPVVAPAADRAKGTYTIPSVKGVQYKVDGKIVKPGTYTSRSRVWVDASAASSKYTLAKDMSKVVSYVLDLTPTRVKPAAPVINKGTYEIPLVPGVRYEVDGKTVKPGTHSAKKGAVVTVKTRAADRGWILGGKQSWQLRF